MHILVPGGLSVQEGHAIAEKIENEIRQELSQVALFSVVAFAAAFLAGQAES